MTKKNSKLILLLPVLLAFAVIFGIFLGQHIQPKGTTQSPQRSIFKKNNANSAKLEQIIQLLESDYVDTVDLNRLTDAAIEALLAELDPHSAYIAKSEFQIVNDDMSGNFEGVGIEFNVQKDTIVVVAAISGGPSEAVGIQPGDRIIQIEDEVVAGVKIQNQEIISKLRGKKGTKVTVHIQRGINPKLIPFTITRNKIPIYSVEASYMIDPKTGYIKINRFSGTTYNEYMTAFNKLVKNGMSQLILDLRQNPGGYLGEAIHLADEFLQKGDVIVYTEGKARDVSYHRATSKGKFEKAPLAILIDEGSASASEIVSGAIQDNDRGIIIGRRSFGKGLVQEQIDFKDSSAIRLTVARYYTASGRSIQRPYNNGIEQYYLDAYKDETSYHSTKDTVADSVKAYFTKKGRKVYAAGGITPDIYIPYDTSMFTPFYYQLISRGIINEFAFQLADKNRDKWKKQFASYQEFAHNKIVDQEIFNGLLQKGKEASISPKSGELEKSKNNMVLRTKALIARNIWGNEGFYYIYNAKDPFIENALKYFENPVLN